MSVTAVTTDGPVLGPGATHVAGVATRRSGPSRGIVQILVASALFGLAGSVAKVALDAGIDPARLTALRCAGAAVGLLIVLAITRPSLLRIARRDVPMLLVLSLCGAALIQWLYFVAIDRLPVGVALLLEFTAPLLVALFSRFVLRYAIDRRVWLGLGIALAGLAMVAQLVPRGALGRAGLDPVGVAAAFGAAGCLAAFYLAGKHALGRLHPLTLTFWMFAMSTVFWSIAQPWWTFDAAILTRRASLLGSMDSFSVPVWVPVVWVIALGTLMPYALELASLRHLSPTATSVVAMSEPVIAAAVAWVWLGESLGPVQLAGALVVLTGVVIVQLFSPTEPQVAAAHLGFSHGRITTARDGAHRLGMAVPADA